MSKLVAIIGGGDWYDASVDFVEVTDNLTAEAMRDGWNKWYNEEYLPNFRGGTSIEYMTAKEWMIKEGHAVDADSKVERWED